MKLVRPRFTCLLPWATTMMPGWEVVRHGGVGGVRRWRLTPGISVIRFSSLPTREAILRASSARDPLAGFAFGGAFSLVFFMLAFCTVLSKDSRLAPATPLMFHLTRGIGNKEAGSGYRLMVIWSYCRDGRGT